MEDRNLKILFITNVPLRGNSTSFNLIKYIDKRFKNFSILKAADSEENPQIVNAQVIYCRKVKIFGYIINPIKMFIDLKKNTQFKKYDICICDAPNVGIVGVLLKILKNTKILVYQDVDYQAGFFKNGLKKFIIYLSERLCIRYSDLIVSVSQNLYYLRKSQTKKRVVEINNGVDKEKFKNISRIRKLTEEKFKLIFVGRLDDQNVNLENLLYSIAILKKSLPNILLAIVGDGTNKRTLINICHQLNICDNVLFTGRVDFSEIPNLLNDADIGIAPYVNNNKVKYSFPLKIVEYMSAGLPVIATGVGEVENIIKKSNAGILAHNTPEGIAEKVKYILANKEEYISCSKNALQYTKNLNWDTLFNKEFEEIFKLLDFRNTGT